MSLEPLSDAFRRMIRETRDLRQNKGTVSMDALEALLDEARQSDQIHANFVKMHDDNVALLDDQDAELKRLKAQIVDLHKWRSQRRQMIRDGWSVEFDRESGHELWVLDDPPLEKK